MKTHLIFELSPVDAVGEPAVLAALLVVSVHAHAIRHRADALEWRRERAQLSRSHPANVSAAELEPTIPRFLWYGRNTDDLTSRPAAPRGWMSWEIFRCDIDCKKDPENCIGEHMYKGQVDALKAGGFVAAGYTGIHMDDCWEEKKPRRDPTTGRLQPNATRFPSGLKALGDYMHANGATFGLYTAESPSTCGGYQASANNEVLDAKSFADWGVDYLKVDGCGPASYYKGGYKAMGAALEASGRDIVYSCSWPAYINGGNESLQPFGEFINDGCNLWRNCSSACAHEPASRALGSRRSCGGCGWSGHVGSRRSCGGWAGLATWAVAAQLLLAPFWCTHHPRPPTIPHPTSHIVTPLAPSCPNPHCPTSH